MSEPESHRYELDVVVKRHGQPDARLSREYVSDNAASTDGALGEIWRGVSDQTKAKMHPVADGA